MLYIGNTIYLSAHFIEWPEKKQEHNNRLVEWTKKKEGMRLKIVIPQANTHSNVAKEQHLVPRIYMKQWSYNDSNSVYI